jgi:hypothetical protein
MSRKAFSLRRAAAAAATFLAALAIALAITLGVRAALAALAAAAPSSALRGAAFDACGLVPERDDGFSSFECIGTGSQFPVDCDGGGGPCLRPNGWFDQPGAAHAICKLRDVCFVGRQLTYFENPAVEGAAPPWARFSSFPDGGPACIGLIAGVHVGCNKTPSVAVVRGPRPAALGFAAPRCAVHFLDRLSAPSNWGHLMHDTLIPAFAAAAIFGDDPAAAQLLLGNDCGSFTDNPGMAHQPANVRLSGGLLPREKCAENVRRWVPALLAHPPLFPPHADGCFRAVVVGHSHALSLGHWYAHRGAAVREARLAAHARLDLPLPEARGPPSEHLVVAFVKVLGDTTPALDAGWNACDAAREWARGAVGVRVSCETPSAMTPREQVASLANATVVVSEHGSTTYLAAFARPGASLLVVGSNEAHVLLGLPDVRVLYLTLAGARGGEGPRVLQLALDASGRRVGLPAVPPWAAA